MALALMFILFPYVFFFILASSDYLIPKFKKMLKNWDIGPKDFGVLFLLIILTIMLTMLPHSEKNLLKCDKCENGNLVYIDTINYDNGTTFYRYHCDNCDRLFRTEKWRGK